MKVSPDRIKARAEQLRSQGFKLRGSAVRATLELNAGAPPQLDVRDNEQEQNESAKHEPAKKSQEAA